MLEPDSHRQELLIDITDHFAILRERVVRIYGIDREVAELRMNLEEIVIELREAGSGPLEA